MAWRASLISCTGGAYSYPSWFIYGQHPVWMCMTLCGPGVKAVNMYAREGACHALMTYDDRMPAEVWYGRPDVGPTYCSGSAHFTKKTYEWTPAVNGNYWFGHHYQIFRMAQVFLKMVETRPASIVIADWLMPEMDGLELTRRIRQLDEAANR